MKTTSAWIALEIEDYDIIAAARSFDTLIELLCEKGYLHKEDSSPKDPSHTLEQNFGDKWKEALKNMSSKRINELFNYYIVLRQIDIIEVK